MLPMLFGYDGQMLDVYFPHLDVLEYFQIELVSLKPCCVALYFQGDQWY